MVRTYALALLTASRAELPDLAHPAMAIMTIGGKTNFRIVTAITRGHRTAAVSGRHA
jgi:hypothetical protein